MGREVKRVPIEFDWPLKKVWDGYLMPERLHEKSCPDCNHGYSPEAQRLHDQWYGSAPFDPTETGSTPWLPEQPEIWAFAERNIRTAPQYYGTGLEAVRSEAIRLTALWNAAWSHHLSQEDVDALVAEGRLHDFTHTWTRDNGWQPIEPTPEVTAAAVNRWSLTGLGHDSLNAWIVIKARCEHLGISEVCATCGGHATVERWHGQRAEVEAWKPIEPPAGGGWQMWETTSEGAPISPVFATAEDLAGWLADSGASLFGSETASRDQWLRIILGEDFAHVQIAPGVVVM